MPPTPPSRGTSERQAAQSAQPPAEAPQRGDEAGTPTQGQAPVATSPQQQPRAEATADDGKVEVLLAHPLTHEESLRRLGLDVEAGLRGEYTVNATIRVARDDARALIGAGYVQVDPEDREAVERVLNPQRAEQQAQAQPQQ